MPDPGENLRSVRNANAQGVGRGAASQEPHVVPPDAMEQVQADLQREHEARVDSELVARLREASKRPGGLAEPDARAALTSLITRYQDRLYAICLRMVGGTGGVGGGHETAADLTQDALLKIIQGLPSFDSRSLFSTWAIRVTMNTCLSHLRSARVRQHARLDAPAMGTDQNLTIGDVRTTSGDQIRQSRELSGPESVELQQRQRQVSAALTSLEPDQRAVLVLRDVQGMEYEQIAEALDVPVGTVKSRLFRARLALRDYLTH